MKYLLDTNICIFTIKKRPPEVLERLRKKMDEPLAIASITLAELKYGVAMNQHQEQNADALTQFLALVSILSFDEKAVSHYGYLLALGGDSHVVKWVKLGNPKRVKDLRYMNFNTMQNYDSAFHIDQMVSGNLFLTSRVLESSLIKLRLYDADSHSVVKSWSFPLVDQGIAINKFASIYYETKQERLFFMGAEALTQVVVIDLKSGQRMVLPARTRNNFGISQNLIVFNHLLMLNEENERLLLNLETLEMQELPSYIKGEYLDNIYMLPNGYILVSYDKFVRSPLEGMLSFNRDRWVVLHDPANNYVSPKYYHISCKYLLYKEEKISYIDVQ